MATTIIDVAPNVAGGIHFALASAHESSMAAAVQLRLAPGRYFLDGLSLNISGNGIDIVASGSDTIISGGLRVQQWTTILHDSGRRIWTAPLPSAGSPRQLWVGGVRAVPARHPNAGFLRWASALPAPFARWGLIYEPNAQLEQWGGDELIGAHVVLFWSWTASRHRIIAHDASARTLIFDRPSRQPLGDHLTQSGRRFLLEGFAAALDAPGEFAVRAAPPPGEPLSLIARAAAAWSSVGISPDATTSEYVTTPPMLLYMPSAADTASEHADEHVESFVATNGLTTLLQVDGSLGVRSNRGVPTPVRGVRISGVTFEHADWQLPRAPRMADWQAAAFLSDAALVLRHVHGAVLSRVTIRHVGGYALWLGDGATNCTFEDGEARDMGAGGVRVGTMELPQTHDDEATGIGTIAGGETADRADDGDGDASDKDGDDGDRVRRPLAVASHNTLLDSRVVDGGHVFREGVGVLVHRSQHNRIEGNEIAHLGYTGVSLGWEWGYAEPSGGGHNHIVGNWIHHIGRWELADMGGVYVLGRADGTLIEGNVIAHIAAYHVYAWGVYLDEGASHVTVRRNLVHHTLSAGLHLHFGFNNTVVENVFACAGGADGDIAISIGEPHLSFVFEGNAVLRCPHAQPEGAFVAGASIASGGVGVRGVDRPPDLPVGASWLLWWKGEGDVPPNVTFGSNVYTSIRPEESSEPHAPPWLHWLKRGRTLRVWQQKYAQDHGSSWSNASALFRDAARCDFRSRPEEPGLDSDERPIVDTIHWVQPSMAVGQPAGGGSGGCGAPAHPGMADPRPLHLAPPPMPPLSPAVFEWMALHVPNGAELSQAYAQQQRQRQLELARQHQVLEHIRASAGGRPLPCWAASHPSRGRYLPECTGDGCDEHGSLAAAAAVCEALGEGCGGVTAIQERGSYQTRAGSTLRKGPSDETSWVRRRCEDDDADGQGDGFSASGGAMTMCEQCAALVTFVLGKLGHRRRSEAGVIEAIDEWITAGDEAHSRSRRRTSAFELLLERAELIEGVLLGSSPTSTWMEVCVQATACSAADV